jgi:hypothetical protein
MIWFVLPFVISHSLQADEVKKLQLKLNENALHSYIERPTPDGLPGSLLAPFLPNSEDDCPEENHDGSHFEVVFVAKGTTQSADSKLVPGEHGYLVTNEDFNGMSIELTHASVLTSAQKVWNEKYDNKKLFDLNNSMARDAFNESLLQASAQAALVMPENELAQNMGRVILQAYPTKPQQIRALSDLMRRQYKVYNSSRNPFANNSSTNPRNFKIPEGDLSLNQITFATANGMKWFSGVCNDFAEGIAMVAATMFPNDDVLVVNTGSHLGVVISDGKTNHVIDSGDVFTQQDTIELKPDSGATNIRIAKVVDGKLKQIAIGDTQVGQVVEEAFQTGKPLLRTSAGTQTVTSHFYRIKERDGKASQLGGSATYGHTNSGEVLVVIAKYQAGSKHWDRYVGLGASGLLNDETKFQLHYRGGMRFHFFQYVNPKLSIRASTGIHTELMMDAAIIKGQARNTDQSYQIDWSHRLSLDANPNSRLHISADIETRNTLGPSNWGATTGATSTFNKESVGNLLSNLRMHLNQVVANATIEEKTSKNTGLIFQGHYQGSAVGQNVGILAGLEIKGPKGAEILIFTGYDERFKGFETKNNFLYGAGRGAKAGIAVRTRKGIQINAGVRNIATDQVPIVDGGLSVPLSIK